MYNFIVILIGIIVVALVLALNRSGSSEMNNESYSLVVENVISMLETLQKFYKGVSDFSGSVNVIPIDSYGNLYGYGGNKPADRIRISLLFLEEIDKLHLDIINYHANETDADVFFRVEEWEGNTYYMATTSARFEGKYKKFMSFLYRAVREKFPELKMEFDGSRICINHM